MYLWGAPLQPTVAASTMEAEYMAAYAAIQEIVWVRGAMTELGLKGFQLSKDASPTILNMDSNSAIDLTRHRTLSTTRSQSISESNIIGFVSKLGYIIGLNHVPTAEMTSDMMTKAC